MKTLLHLIFLLLLTLLTACSVFRATGRSVDAVGEGVGRAVSGTGQAIEDAADESS
jgi:predicted small secreted protein